MKHDQLVADEKRRKDARRAEQLAQQLMCARACVRAVSALVAYHWWATTALWSGGALVYMAWIAGGRWHTLVCTERRALFRREEEEEASGKKKKGSSGKKSK